MEPENLMKYIFGIIDQMHEYGNKDFELTYIKNLENNVRKYKTYRNVVKIIDKFHNLFYMKRNVPNPRILFVGSRFPQLMKEMSGTNQIVGLVFQWQDRIKFIKTGLPYISANEWNNQIVRAYINSRQNQGNTNFQDLFMHVIADVERNLRYLNIEAVVLASDSLHIERLIIEAAKRANIPTILIQHGIFQSTNMIINDGYYASHFLVWGNHFKDMYLNSNVRNAHNTIVFGYPYSARPLDETGSDRSEYPSLCFLGQPYEKYSTKYSNGKSKVIAFLMEICRDLPVKLVYRPHPGEDREMLKKVFPDIELTSKKESLTEAINKYHLFFSINSTALIEASLYGKVSVQVKVTDIPSDDFNKLGVCHAVNVDKEEMAKFISDFLMGRIPLTGVPSDYIEYHLHIGKRFAEILSSIVGANTTKKGE